jgi:ATP-binding cassette subfamily B protein
MPVEELRGQIGYVPQKAFLFSGTIASNLRYGREDAADEELWRALSIAQAADFVSAMLGKLDAPVAQAGTNLSGGQRQRLSIARALVKRPQIYIFDDSFSALDFRTDAALRQALMNEVKDAVVLIVAQRVSTIMNADQIIVLDQGTVVGIGTHAQLVERCEVYREIVRSQLGEDEVA